MYIVHAFYNHILVISELGVQPFSLVRSAKNIASVSHGYDKIVEHLLAHMVAYGSLWPMVALVSGLHLNFGAHFGKTLFDFST